MKSLVHKDKTYRNFFFSLEIQKLVLKTILYNRNLYNSVRWNAFLNLCRISKLNSKTKLVNRCVLTGRSNSKINKLKFSRLSLKRLYKNGHLSEFSEF